MSRVSNKQLVLKPQDLVVALKLAVSRELFSYARLGIELAMSASEVHGSLKRASAARLIGSSIEERMTPIRPAMHEFLVHGAKYAFPPVLGGPTRGLPTAYAAPLLRDILIQPEELPPVWPHPNGPVRGYALIPLYPSVPLAAERDPRLYEILSLVDAMRIGAARDREIAAKMVLERL